MTKIERLEYTAGLSSLSGSQAVAMHDTNSPYMVLNTTVTSTANVTPIETSTANATVSVLADSPAPASTAYTSWELYAAIVAMALLTYATRALPFLLMQKSKILSRLGSGRFAILGPALLTSTTAVVLYSEVSKAPSHWHIGAYVIAVLTVALALKLSKNIGIAMPSGIVLYGIGLSLI